jgi:hypothetical protein
MSKDEWGFVRFLVLESDPSMQGVISTTYYGAKV